MMKSIITSILLVVCISANAQSIDRKAVVTRNNPVVTQFDALNSLSVGNGWGAPLCHVRLGMALIP